MMAENGKGKVPGHVIELENVSISSNDPTLETAALRHQSNGNHANQKAAKGAQQALQHQQLP